jgi:hypothetical protein
MCFNGTAVFAGTISLIGDPSVMGKLVMEFFHKIIPVGFGQDAGGGNGSIDTIALYNTFVANLFIAVKAIAVNQQKFRFLLKFVNSQVHGLKGSI